MSFTTQKLANAFPTWTKLRNDPSSYGQRILSVFADQFDLMNIEAVKLSRETKLSKQGMGVGELYALFLTGEDELGTLTQFGTQVEIVYPSVEGTLSTSGTVIELTRDETVEDLLYGDPTRLNLVASREIQDNLLFTSATSTYNPMEEMAFLTVVVSNSGEYLVPRTNRNRLVSGNWFCVLVGTNPADAPIRERIQIWDDGTYQSSQIFKTLTEVYWEGFDGQVDIYNFPMAVLEVNDPFRKASTRDFDSPVYWFLELGEQGTLDEDTCFLGCRVKKYKVGAEYREGSGDDISNEEVLCYMGLVDGDGLPINLVDFCINQNNGNLIGVTADGKVWLFEPELPQFNKPLYESTEETLIAILQNNPYAKQSFYQHDYLWTWFRMPRETVKEVIIERIGPGELVTEYLQSDKVSWGPDEYKFMGVNATDPMGSWKDFQFQSSYGDFGQYDFFLTCTSGLGRTYRSHAAVLVPSLTGTLLCDTGVHFCTGIAWTHRDQVALLSEDETSTLYTYSLHRDSYFADTNNQTLYLRESYSSIEVIYV